jgi:hypothetical protein
MINRRRAGGGPPRQLRGSKACQQTKHEARDRAHDAGIEGASKLSTQDARRPWRR